MNLVARARQCLECLAPGRKGQAGIGSRTGRAGAFVGSLLIAQLLAANSFAADTLAAYSFDAITGSSVADASGNGNSLSVLNGAALATGKYGSAMAFDGVDDALVASSYEPALNLTAGFTLSAWIKPRSNSRWQMIVNKPFTNKHSSPYFDWSMHRQIASGRIVLFLGCEGVQRASNATTPLNTWTHVAVTYDGRAIRHYINGILDRTTSASCQVTNTNSRPIRVGSNGGGSETMNGAIDDVRIYGRVLSAAEIQGDMAAAIGGTSPAPDSAVPTSLITSPAQDAVITGTTNIAANATDNVGVIGVQFKVDGQNLGAEDTSAPYGVAWDSTLVANGSHTLLAVARDAAGNLGSSTVVVSVNNQIVVAPTVTIRADPTAVTSGAASTLTWSSTNATSCTATGAWSGSRATAGSVSTGELTAASNTFTLTCIGAGGPASASAVVTVSAPPAPSPTVTLTASPLSVASGGASSLTWSSLDATSCTASGAWSGSRATAGSASTGPLTATANSFVLTCTGAGGSASQSVDVAVISAQPSTGPLSAYSFDAITGSSVADASGNGHSLSVLNGAALATGKYGSAMAFDGVDDALVASSYEPALNLTAGFTLSAWINPRSNSRWQMIVNKPFTNNHSSPYFDWSMHRQIESGRIVLFLGCEGVQRASNATTPLNTWTHVAVTYDGRAIRHYINGILDRTTSVSCQVTNTNSRPIRVGSNGGGSETMNGAIDDVRIYGRVLSAAEIQGDMAAAIGSASPAPDSLAPTVSVSAPTNGSTVSGTVSVDAVAADDVGVSGVQFRLDGANLGAEDLIAPYSVSWSSTAVSDGSHTLVAVARDATGNATTSSAVTVTVANNVPAPTLSATLSATPSSGNAPLNGVDLTAIVSGTATGPITYTFYCNRADSSTSISQPWDLQVNSVEATLAAADVCNYASPGSYVAKVIAQRGATAAEARTSVTVSAPPNIVQVQLTASPTSVAIGGMSGLTWSSLNADSCTASGAWSGARATSGSASTAPLIAQSNTFTLTCSGSSGSASSSAVVTVDDASAVQGLSFPSNGDAPADAFVAFQFANPQNNGLPLWGPSGQGATYMWRYRPRQQDGYYVTFWWSQADGNFNPSAGFYGGHPYPNDGHSLPPLVNVGTHNWEIATFGLDIQTTRAGSEKAVIKDVWYTQALKVVRNSANSKTITFYTSLPSTANADVIEYTVTESGYGETTPPNPKITFGDSPWYPGYQHERLSGVIRHIKIFNIALSEGDILAEAASESLVTPAGQANVWYMNINPTPDDIADKSGRGHNPVWAGPERAQLWTGQ